MTLLVCCSFGIAEPTVSLLFGMMPAALVIRGADAQDSALATLLDTMAEEVAPRASESRP